MTLQLCPVSKQFLVRPVMPVLILHPCLFLVLPHPFNESSNMRRWMQQLVDMRLVLKMMHSRDTHLFKRLLSIIFADVLAKHLAIDEYVFNYACLGTHHGQREAAERIQLPHLLSPVLPSDHVLRTKAEVRAALRSKGFSAARTAQLLAECEQNPPRNPVQRARQTAQDPPPKK